MGRLNIPWNTIKSPKGVSYMYTCNLFTYITTRPRVCSACAGYSYELECDC